MNKKPKCWICGRTNKDLRLELEGLSNNSSLILSVKTINGTVIHHCVPCEQLLSNFSLDHLIEFSRTFNKSFERLDEQIENLTGKVEQVANLFNGGEKKKDEFKEVV